MEQLDINYLTLEQASAILKMGTRKLRAGLIQGVLPFGVAIKETEGVHRYSFLIPEPRLMNWIQGADMKGERT